MYINKSDHKDWPRLAVQIFSFFLRCTLRILGNIKFCISFEGLTEVRLKYFNNVMASFHSIPHILHMLNAMLHIKRPCSWETPCETYFSQTRPYEAWIIYYNGRDSIPANSKISLQVKVVKIGTHIYFRNIWCQYTSKLKLSFIDKYMK